MEYSNFDAPLPLGSPPILPSALAGQPPMIEWMTIHLDSLVGCLSLVRETWHEPPPCVALPMNESVCLAPMGMMLLAPCTSKAPVRSLHGKSDPSAMRGELLSEELP